MDRRIIYWKSLCENLSLSLNCVGISHSILHWGIISEVDIFAVRAVEHFRFCMEFRRSRDEINEILSQQTQLALRCFTNGASARRYQFRSQVSCRRTEANAEAAAA